MTLDDYEKLEQSATPGDWYGRRSLFDDGNIQIHGDEQACVGAANIVDSAVIIISRNVSKELIALVRAAKGYRKLMQSDCDVYPELVRGYLRSLDAAIAAFEKKLGEQ